MDIREENELQLQSVYQNLRALRRARGWSLAERSARSGVSRKTLAKMERGRDFDLVSLVRLCGVYQIPIPDIFLQYKT